MCIFALVLAFSKQTQQMKEEVDNVKVEVDRRVNVLFRRHLVHDHVCVKDDEEREQNCTSTSQSTVHRFTSEKQLIKYTRTQTQVCYRYLIASLTQAFKHRRISNWYWQRSSVI